MDTIEQQLIKLAQIKENIRQAINSRGVMLTTDDVFSIYPDAIMRIGIHKITTSFEGITSDAPLTIKDEKSLTINLTPESGVNIGLVTVLMGDNDITSTSYSNGVISISSVTDDVSITAIGIIDFADSTVKSLCVSNWGGDVVQNEITIGEAMQVTSLDGVFRTNRNITSFNELKFFTGLTQFTTASNNTGQGEFYNCVNLASVTLPSATIAGGMRGLFCVCNNLTEIDLSPLKTQSSFNIYYMCRLAEAGTKLKKVILPNGNYSGSAGYAFINQAGLTTIEIDGIADFSGVTSFSAAFSSCSSLATITGIITNIKADLNISACPLTRDSALILLNGLTQVSTVKKITFNYSTYNLLTDADIAIATTKNWQVETIIEWEDNNLRDYILAQFPNNVGLTYSGEITNLELASITSLDGKFRGVSYFDEEQTKPFYTFDELRFFTGLESLYDSYANNAYNGQLSFCSNLTNITLPAAPISNWGGAFRQTPSASNTSLITLDMTPVTAEEITLNAPWRECYRLESLKIPASTYKGTMRYGFRNCTQLITIEIEGNANISAITDYFGCFNNCQNLANIIGEITGIKYNLDLSSCPLTAASAMVILNGLIDLTGGTSNTLTLSSTTKSALTAAGIDYDAIAAAKNWTIV